MLAKLGVLRSETGSWTCRGLIHGSGFYFGRFVRLMLISLLSLWVLFRLNGPFASWADGHAREAVSETGALFWLFGRHAVLLLAILLLNMLSSFAKVIIVVEERSSAVLAYCSAISFCVRHLLRAAGQYLAVGIVAVALLAVWSLLDGAWETTGYKTQIVTLLLGQGLVFGRIALRLVLLSSQLALYRGSLAPVVSA